MTQHAGRKVAAISAGVAILALGATYTLASWNDSEWVWGGTDGGEAGVGTSAFQVQQNIDYADDDGWTDEPDSPGQALVFTTGALDLNLGDSIYAPVSLRTVAGSGSGTVALQGAAKAESAPGVTIGDDEDGLLWDAMRVTVFTSDAATPPSCDVAGETSWGTAIAGLANVPLSTAAGATQALAAGADADTPGAPQHYCFKLTLPTGASPLLQGRSIAPAWEFLSTSD